jgi:hypothetical protein
MMKWSVLSVVLLLMLGVAACGSGGDAKPTMLHVTRNEELSGYDFAPLDVTVRDVNAIQHLYQAAYALPKPPSGTINCPNDIGLTYHLEFFEGDTSVQQMDLDATGCQFLQITHDEVRMSDGGFRESLRKLIGIPSLVPPIPGRP